MKPQNEAGEGCGGAIRRYNQVVSVVKVTMDMQNPAVKATLRLGSETRSIESCKGILSEQLVFVKGESMNMLKEYITKHNVPNDVPDEILSEDDDGDCQVK